MTQRALVVEDDPDVRDLVVLSLELDGLDVSTAETGAAAVERVRELDPDVVTLDLTLPDADGRDVCRRIREVSDTRILLVTGRAEAEDRRSGLEAGADDFMTKPFTPTQLRARISELLARPRAG